MTVDAVRRARRLDTVRETGNSLTVAFNYRFNPAADTPRIGSAPPHGDTTAEHSGGVLTLRPLWRPPVDLPLVTAHEAHGCGDPRMLDALFVPSVPAGRGQETAAQVQAR
jgi:hypothetical protein